MSEKADGRRGGCRRGEEEEGEGERERETHTHTHTHSHSHTETETDIDTESLRDRGIEIQGLFFDTKTINESLIMLSFLSYP